MRSTLQPFEDYQEESLNPALYTSPSLLIPTALPDLEFPAEGEAVYKLARLKER